MKTDLKKLKKTNKAIVLFVLGAIMVFLIAFVLFDSLAFQVVTSILVLIAISLYITFKMSYQEHKNIMSELKDKETINVVLWLIDSKADDQSALIDFLDRDSLLALKAALEIHMDFEQNLDLLPLYHKITESL